MQERHLNKEQYFKEQVYTTEHFVIPYLESFMEIIPEMKVLEIGCGEGGNLLPFLDKGCKATGLDILHSKIDNARKFLSEYSFKHTAVLIAEDIYHSKNLLDGPYDLIIMRDVIEHIHDQDRFMGFVKRFLKTEGLFFLAFPPWYSPFGGHQQVCQNKILSKLPYFHLFPAGLYRAILKLFGESEKKVEGLLEIKQTGISIERFRKVVKKKGYRVKDETMFFVNPNYLVKFGLKPRKQNTLITIVPFFRNFFTTACYYTLELNDTKFD